MAALNHNIKPTERITKLVLLRRRENLLIKTAKNAN